MGKPYSMDLRARVVSSVEREGLSRRQAAVRYEVGISTVIRWVRRLRETSSFAPGKMGGIDRRRLPESIGSGCWRAAGLRISRCAVLWPSLAIAA